MSHSIQRELLLAQPRDQVWQALTDRHALAEWMFPNDFEPRLGHRFSFHVPPNPKAGFEGLVIQCEVTEIRPPSCLKFSWSAGGAVNNSTISYRLEPDGEGTRLFFEHAGFDFTQPSAEQAYRGAEFGWTKMLKQLTAIIERSAAKRPSKSSD